MSKNLEIVLSEPQFEIFDSTLPFNLAMFGQGSGKTHLMGCISADFLINFPSIDIFIAANTERQLTQSTMKRVRSVWKEYYCLTEWSKENPRGQYVVGVQPPKHFNTEGHYFNSYRGIVSFEWGAVAYYGSLENYKAHDGKEFAVALLDETKDTREEALKEVIMGRLRQEGIYILNGEISSDPSGEPFNPLYIFTTPAKVPWLNEFFNLEEFYDDITEKALSEETFFCQPTRENMLTVIASTYHNSDNIPANYIENRTTGLNEQEIQMLIYAIPFAKTGGEAFKDFQLPKHSKDLSKAYKPDLPLFISFDFNVAPYLTLKVFQVLENPEGGYIVYSLPEIASRSPFNSTEGACREFKKRYKSHESGVYIFGDPSGKTRDTRTKQGTNDFTIIKTELSNYHTIEKVPSKAPARVARLSFMNAIFRGELPIKYFEHKGNTESLRDFMYCKEDPKGGKLKQMYHDKTTGQRYEKYGHMSDAIEYFLAENFSKFYKKFAGKRTKKFL